MKALLCHFARVIALLVALLVSQGVAEAQADICPIPAETVTGRVTAQNGFAWNYGYDIDLKDGMLLVNVAINLIPAGGVTRPELDRVKPAWEAGIERIWSEQFALETPSGQRYPIIVDVTFKGPRFHHEVVVRPGGGRSDELNWNLLDSPELAAHEFGHMLGVFDEYRRGAIAPQSGIIDTTSIMTSNPTAGMTYARHYKEFLAWFVNKSKLRDVALVPNKGRARQ